MNLPVRWKVKGDVMKISDLAAAGGTTPKTIRFYEQAGVLPEPVRTPGGYRDYGPEFVTRLAFVRRSQAAGLSLREVRQILAIRDGGEEPCGHVRGVLAQRLEDVHARIAELVTLETHLQTLLAHARHGEPTDHDNSSVCWILETDPVTVPEAADEPTT
jgi:DNA-binding transcriptional MerR regulator